MYNEDDFRKLPQDVLMLQNAAISPEKIAQIRDKIMVLVSCERSKISSFYDEKKIRLLRAYFFEDFKKLSGEEIPNILNHLALSKEFSAFEISEFSQVILSNDEEKISLILNSLNPSLQKDFFRRLIHGDSLESLISKDDDKIIAVIRGMNLRLQDMLLTEINFITGHNFFDDFVRINISFPHKISQMLNSLNPDLCKKLFIQKDPKSNKSFFDKFLEKIAFDHEKVTAVIDGLRDDLKSMVFAARDERGINPLESALIEISQKFAAKKHRIITKLRPLKDVQDAWLQKLEKQDFDLSAIVDVNYFYEVFVAIDMLERIYQQTDIALNPVNTAGDIDLIYDILSRSKTANDPQNKVFLDAISAIKAKKIGENIHILDANHIDHNAYFIVKCDADNFPIKIFYIDGWGGIFGKNSSNYSFGSVEFDIDSSKVSSLEDLDNKLTNFFEGKKYPSKEEMSEILSQLVRCDEKNNPIIIGKDIPTKTQKRNNCHLKSTLLLMRQVAENIDPTLEFLINQKKWSPEFEKDGFLEFNHSALSGKGRDLYKKFRNDFIDEQISVLANACDRNIHPFLSRMILSCLENIKSKTEQKQFNKQDASDEDDNYVENGSTMLQEIYKSRLNIINKATADLLEKKPSQGSAVRSATGNGIGSNTDARFKF